MYDKPDPELYAWPDRGSLLVSTTSIEQKTGAEKGGPEKEKFQTALLRIKEWKPKRYWASVF